MTTEDDSFLTSYNKNRPANSKLSEDGFEEIMEVFEETAENQAPFASVDNTVITFEVMESNLRVTIAKELHPFAKDIYDFWKIRRQDSGNKALQPSLKFETQQDNDDGDPYVCFRRREVRQTRKTRARDTQSTEKLRKLRKEIEDAIDLVRSVYRREELKGQVLAVDRSVFEQRAKLKDAKVHLGIKDPDDDLINHKVCCNLFIL